MSQLLNSPKHKRGEIRAAPSIMAEVVDQPRSLILEACERAFWDICKERLLWCCRYSGAAADPWSEPTADIEGAALFHLVFLIARHYCVLRVDV